jgi:hypothetical protein
MAIGQENRHMDVNHRADVWRACVEYDADPMTAAGLDAIPMGLA